MSTYQPSKRVTDQIENAFVYHPPIHEKGQVERYQRLRNKAKELAQMIAEEAPECREQSLAFTNLEQACFWTNAAIARHESP